MATLASTAKRRSFWRRLSRLQKGSLDDRALSSLLVPFTTVRRRSAGRGPARTTADWIRAVPGGASAVVVQELIHRANP